MNKKIIYGLIAICIFVAAVGAAVLSIPKPTPLIGSAITVTRTVSVMSSTGSYTTTTTSVTITGTTCDLMFSQYQGGKEYKAFGVAYGFVQLDGEQFMDAINHYQHIGSQRILYRGELSVANHQGTGIQGQTWFDALYFFDNGAAVVYPCP